MNQLEKSADKQNVCPQCPECKTSKNVKENPVKETVAAQKMKRHGFRITKFYCSGCGHDFG